MLTRHFQSVLNGRLLSHVVFIVICSGLSACALSPMQVTLDPQMTEFGPPVGGGREIWIDVYDQRPTDVLGERGGIYRETSVTRLETPPDQTLQKVLVEAFQRMGFVVRGPQVDNTLSVFIDEISFGSPSDDVSNKVQMAVRLRVAAKNSTGEYTNSYSGSGEKVFAIAPSRRATEEHLNKLVADTLARLIKDKALSNFLTR